jgi:DNA-binding PadR family transcriptional regulator
MNNELYTQFDNVFFEKTRLSMMTMLYQEKTVSFNRFKNIISGTDGAIYSHLQKLQEAEYISQKKKLIGDKAQTFYSLTPKGSKLFQDYLKFLENIILQK